MYSRIDHTGWARQVNTDQGEGVQVQLSCYGFAHKWSHKSALLRKEEGKEGPLMVSGQGGQPLLQYVV